MNKKTVMIFNGGGFKTAMFIGMLKAARELGKNPDYIIGTCGGSAATAVAHGLRTTKEQIEFIRGKDSFDFINSIQETKYFNLNHSISMIRDVYLKFRLRGVIPNIFEHYLLDMPQLVPLVDDHTSFEPLEHKSIIVAAEILYNESAYGKKRNEALFQQVFFTDSDTAKLLDGVESPSYNMGRSSVAKETKVVEGVTLAQASRASVTDPFFINPAEVNGKRYVTGAVDLYPVELAKSLGDEIIMCHPEKFSFLESGLIWASFYYSQNKRYSEVFSDIDVDHLADIKDFPDELKYIPEVNWLKWQILSKIPKDYESYVKVVDAQFEYGYKKMIETIRSGN